MTSLQDIPLPKSAAGNEPPPEQSEARSGETPVLYPDAVFFRVPAGSSDAAAMIVRRVEYNADEHHHPEAQISILLKAEEALFLTQSDTGRKVKTPVVPGAVVYIPSEQPHRTLWTGLGELVNIYFPAGYVEAFAEKRYEMSKIDRSGYRLDKCAALLGQMLLDEFDWTGFVSEEMVDHARFLLIAHFLRVIGLGRAAPLKGSLSLQRLKPALERLRDQPEQPVSLAELARMCHSSVFHFARSFTDRVGCPPFAYQRSARISRASKLLLDPEYTIERVAYKVGIQSAASFSRMFRRETGSTPSEFRRKLLQGQR